MKTILSLSLLIFGTLFQVSAQDFGKIIKPELSEGNKVQPQLILLDSLETNYAIGLESSLERNTLNSVTKLPYPIIFVHGLNSSRTTWNETKNLLTSLGLTNGGYFDANLNYDVSLLNSNKSNDTHLYYSSSNAVSGGDLYFVNFAVNTGGIVYLNPDGTIDENCFNLSNQSAITKQGYILKDIIMNVMQLTGKTKVVLMGHSMGGLASREYLQNPENWQIDGQPHVAKLATTGTPHGGSNMTDGGLFTGIDFSSEAIRDLKKTSVFLEGGYETWVSSSYYNSDVNCNGISNDGSFVLGLNQRDFSPNIDYSCVIGTALSILGVGGDGAVSVSSANINNANISYPNLTQNIFSVFKNHKQLPSDWYTIMQALDEPNDFGIAYEVSLNNPSYYYAYNSTQSTSSNYVNDYDDYKFSVSNSSNVNFIINKPTGLNLNARLVSSNLTQLGPIFSNNGGSTIGFYANNLPQGDYYLEIYGMPITNFISPYNFSLTSTLSNSEFTNSNSLNIYPNPTSSLLYFDNSTQKYEMATIKNNLGQIVSQIRFDNFNSNQEIDLSNYSRGMYMITFTNQDKAITKKVILE